MRRFPRNLVLSVLAAMVPLTMGGCEDTANAILETIRLALGITDIWV